MKYNKNFTSPNVTIVLSLICFTRDFLLTLFLGLFRKPLIKTFREISLLASFVHNYNTLLPHLPKLTIQWCKYRTRGQYDVIHLIMYSEGIGTHKKKHYDLAHMIQNLQECHGQI